MWINPTEQILDLDGKPIPIEPGKFITVANMIVNVLMANLQGDEARNGNQKMECFDLATKFHSATMPVDISYTEADLIMQRAEKGLPTLTYARLRKAMDKARAQASDEADAASRKPNGKGQGKREPAVAIRTGD